MARKTLVGHHTVSDSAKGEEDNGNKITAAFSGIQRSEIIVFILSFLVTMGFALFTNNAWEDWYITFRASKNLAMGNGLVFWPGQRIHSFTSPIGTLIPAFYSWITGNHNDDLVLWLFRITNAIVLGIAAVLLLRLLRSIGWNRIATASAIGLFLLDVKMVAYSINGMETAFMMLFLIANLYILLTPVKRFSLWLGIVWAGLQWTRPDGFVYALCIVIAILLFVRASPHSEGSYPRLFQRLLPALALAAVLYLPWLLGTWLYYGTPVPHTIIAKGALTTHHPLSTRLLWFTDSLYTNMEETSFAPPYNILKGSDGKDGWELIHFLPLVNLLCILYLLNFSKRVPAAGSVFAFAFLLAQLYMTAIVPQAAPWYMPNVAPFGLLSLGAWLQWIALDSAMLQSGANVTERFLRRRIGTILGMSLVIGQAIIFCLVAVQLREQQRIIEWGSRKKIGLWLKAHAKTPQDTVFMECLGYIGYYSGLKTYDTPGMSSPEVVAVRKRLQSNNYGFIINELKPDWVVLRPHELEGILHTPGARIAQEYDTVLKQDVSKKIQEASARIPIIGIPGKGFLEYDSVFLVLHRKSSR